MYILYKLENRAETTDTVLFFAANERESLEEVMLSLFDELVEKEMEWAARECNMSEEDINLHSLVKWCIDRMKSYNIIWIPELKE